MTLFRIHFFYYNYNEKIKPILDCNTTTNVKGWVWLKHCFIIMTLCNVPDPSTSEEDATMALTIQAGGPMNMWIHKNAETECIEVQHTHMQLSIIHSRSNIHSCKHSFNMFITFINRKYDCRSKIDKITYLIKSSFCNQLQRSTNHRLACS